MSSHDHKTVVDSLNLITIKADPKKMAKIFGPRYTAAWGLIKEKKIIKTIFEPSGKVIWTVRGNRKAYQILPNAAYCTCDDFYFSVIDGKALGCKHLIAQKLSQALFEYRKQVLPDSEYEKFQKKLREQHLLSISAKERTA